MIEFLQYPLALLVTLGVLVTFHELGHYVVARWSGVRIVRFSVGFGRPIWSRTDRHGTEWAVAAIPLGGYVRMLDEREPGTVEAEARPGDVSYNDLTVGWRAAIAAAGPLANFLLAIVVYWFLFVAGNTTIAPMLGDVPEGSPADRAGLSAGLEIVSVDGQSARSWQQVTMALAGRLGDSGAIDLGVRRPGTGPVTQASLTIDGWHRGVDEPDLLASLGIEPALPPVLGEIMPDSPAQRAGLRQYDRVVAVDGEPRRAGRTGSTRSRRRRIGRSRSPSIGTGVASISPCVPKPGVPGLTRPATWAWRPISTRSATGRSRRCRRAWPRPGTRRH